MISQLHKNKTRHSLINNRSLFVPRNLEVLDETEKCSNHERIDPASKSLRGRLFIIDQSQHNKNPLFQSHTTNTPTCGSPRSCHSHLSSPEPIFDEERINELLELLVVEEDESSVATAKM